MFAIPTLDALTDRARKAFRANLPGSDAWLWPNNVNPMTKVMAGLTFELFGFADDVQQQKFAVTATGDGLDAHGAEVGLGRKPARASGGTIAIASTDGISVSFGALIQRLDGVQFSATAPASSTGAGTLNVPVAATTTGSDTNTLAGTAVTILSGLTDPNGNATAQVGSDGLTGGTDIELDGEPYTTDLGTYRGRILFRKRNAPQGGSAADYVLWATQSPVAVTRVFVERLWAGFGTVRVTFMMDDTYANGIPQAGDVAQVNSYIQSLAPAGAVVSVVAPTAVPVNVTVHSLSPSTPATQSAVAAELAATFRRLGAVAGNDSGAGGMPFLATPTSFALSWIEQAVANAIGVARGSVAAPSADVALIAPQIATLGTLSFT